MLVKDWMTTFVYTAGPDAPLSEVMHLMKEKGVRHVPIVEGKTVIGLLSDRDIKEYIPSKGTSLDIYELNYLLAQTKAKQVMKKPVATVPPETPVEEAAMALFDKHIGCLPVVDDGKLVGIISDRDMFRVLVEITGARHGGARVSLAIEDKPGSIKDVADVVRKHGFRMQSIMSTNEKASPGQRYVVIRTRGDGNYAAMVSELKTEFKNVRTRKG